MTLVAANSVVSMQDQRLISVLQHDGRLTAERAAEVLNVSPGTVRRRWQAMTADGILRVVLSPIARPRASGLSGAHLLHIRVRHDKLDAVVRSLAARDDIPFVDITTSGDEILVIAATEPGSRDPLVFRQLPSSLAVISVETATILHVLRVTSEWRHQVLAPHEIDALAPGAPCNAAPAAPADNGHYGVGTDALERVIIDALTPTPGCRWPPSRPAPVSRRRSGSRWCWRSSNW